MSLTLTAAASFPPALTNTTFPLFAEIIFLFFLLGCVTTSLNPKRLLCHVKHTLGFDFHGPSQTSFSWPVSWNCESKCQLLPLISKGPFMFSSKHKFRHPFMLGGILKKTHSENTLKLSFPWCFQKWSQIGFCFHRFLIPQPTLMANAVHCLLSCLRCLSFWTYHDLIGVF